MRVEQRWVVEGGPLRKPWLPKHVVDCDGRPFAELKTADKSMYEFCDWAAKNVGRYSIFCVTSRIKLWMARF